jgi:hypothetical protein
MQPYHWNLSKGSILNPNLNVFILHKNLTISSSLISTHFPIKQTHSLYLSHTKSLMTSHVSTRSWWPNLSQPPNPKFPRKTLPSPAITGYSIFPFKKKINIPFYYYSYKSPQRNHNPFQIQTLHNLHSSLTLVIYGFTLLVMIALDRRKQLRRSSTTAIGFPRLRYVRYRRLR